MILIRIGTDKGPVTALFSGTVREAEPEVERLKKGIEKWGRVLWGNVAPDPDEEGAAALGWDW